MWERAPRMGLWGGGGEGGEKEGGITLEGLFHSPWTEVLLKLILRHNRYFRCVFLKKITISSSLPSSSSREEEEGREEEMVIFFKNTHRKYLLCLRMSFKRTSVQGEWKRPSSVIPPSFSPPSPPPPHSPIRGALSHMCVLPALRTHKAPLFLVLLSRCFCESRCR